MFTRALKALTVAAAAVGLSAFGVGAAAAITDQQLVGHWQGTSLVGISSCGTAVAEFTFGSDASYLYKNLSQNCAAFAVGGRYTVQGNTLVLAVQQCAPMICTPGATQQWPISEVDDNTITVGGRMFHRQ
jgi:hypothetical protein